MSITPEIWIPGSKSHSIRALLIAAFSRGRSRIRNLLISSDTLSTMEALKRLNVKITYDKGSNEHIVDSKDLGKGLESAVLDLGNSGTGTYLLMGLAASLEIPVTITGDESLSSRPIGPLAEAYRSLGAHVEDNKGYLPVTITGPLKGGFLSIECRTSQYLSSLLLAGVLSKGDLDIACPILFEKPYVGMTLRWLDEQKIEYEISKDYQKSFIRGGQCFKALDATISGDYSSASFFFGLAAISGKKINILGLEKNDSQGDKRVLEVLEKMGCTIEWIDNGVSVQGPEKLKGGSFDINDIPDALPILSAVATQAEEEVKLYNVAQARIKETDRIASMAENLSILGADVTEMEDGLTIRPSVLHKAKVKGYDDHRIIMAMAILSYAVKDGIEIDDTSRADVTFPTFFELYEKIKKELSDA